jgi:polar amino acid transport system substrate-binding protein
MSNIIKIIFILLIFIIFSHAKNLRTVTLQLQWLDQFQFAGYYIAKEKGFYKDVNLDVKILKYQNDLKIIDSIISQEATFATGRTSLLIHKNNGYPVVALAAIFQHSPAALLVTDKNIKKPIDLKNKRIMISPDAITSASYMSMLFSEGMMEDNFTVQQHSFNLNDLIDGKTDAIASYISNEPYRLERKGIEYKYFHPKDYGFDFYGDILYTSEIELENNPKDVENFTKASLKGWKYAFENIEETAKLIQKKYNSQNKTLDELIYEGKILKELAYSNNKTIGDISKNKFNEIAKVYRLLGLIKKDYKVDDFIYDINSPKKQILNKEERKWLSNNKKIRVATNKEWTPIEFFEDGIYSGIASGYLNLLEKKLEIEFDIQTGSYWHDMITKIKNKELDLFLAIVNTPKRNEYMDFTSSYLKFPTIIVTRDTVGYIRDIKQLSNKTVAVERKFYTEELIQKYNKDIKLIPVNTTKDALTKVYNETAFAYIGSLPTSGYYIKKLKYTNLKINGEVPFDTTLSFSTRKDLKIFHSILQKTLDSISKEEHEAIYNKWLNIEYEKDVDYTFITLIILIILLITITLYFRNRDLKVISETDSLTNLANRRKIDSFLEIEMERSQRNSLTFSIAMFDIDFFKNVNDTYGHRAGDKVLKKISKIFKSNIRKYDLAGRWGGEEFILICPNSNLEQTIALCNKLKNIIEKTPIKELNNNNITVSCGIAQYIENDTIDDSIYRADCELYKAKKDGRNCIYPKTKLT